MAARALVLVSLLAAPALAAPVPAPAPVPSAFPTADPRDAVARALAFTVTIEGGETYGSGVLIDPGAGLVLTAHHVVEEMRAPLVTFADGTSVPARVIESDRVLDLALLAIAPQPTRPAPALGDALALRPGDELYAVGCPRHLGFTVSRGIVSFVGRRMDGVRWLQSDLPINDGNSGGPVVNARGELVGVMSFILRRGQGLSFALPINYPVERWASRLGVRIRDVAAYVDKFKHWLQVK